MPPPFFDINGTPNGTYASKYSDTAWSLTSYPCFTVFHTAWKSHIHVVSNHIIYHTQIAK